TMALNYISAWVSTRILSSPSERTRALTIAQFVEIANHLRALNNYQTLSAILIGLTSSAVNRLYKTWQLFETLDDGLTAQKLRGLNDLVGMDRQYAKYFEAYNDSDMPCIPMLHVNIFKLVRIDTMDDFVTAPSAAAAAESQLANRAFNSASSSDLPSTKPQHHQQQHVNWKKFDHLGDEVLGLRRLQEQLDYRFESNLSLMAALKHQLTLDSDTLYARSLQLEPRPKPH
ncbi:ras GEF, partial [Ramicandelaber brevisporus]